MLEKAGYPISQTLLLRIAEGDEQAFASFFEEMLPMLQASVFKMVQSEEGMKEVIQEAFIRVWLKRDQLPVLEKPLHWLFRVTANESFTWLRKQALHKKHVDMYAAENDSDPFPVAVDRLSLQETQQLIHQAVLRLSPQRRLIYQMSRNEGLKTVEIAEKLNLSHSHVRNTLTMALQSVREYLEAAGKVIPLLLVLLK